MTRHASPDELSRVADGVLRHRKAARTQPHLAKCARWTRVRQARGDQQRSIARCAHRARLTLLGEPAEGRKRRIHTIASPSAISCPSSVSQPNAPAQEEGPSDAELLRSHVGGDPDAFGDLFGRHRDRLWAVAVRTLGDPEEAADAVQDAMIAAFQRAHQFRGDSAVTTWLHRIVVNAALDRTRRRAARPTTAGQAEEALDALATGGRSLGDPSDSSDTAIDVRAALRQLVPEQQAALVLVDMLGYTVVDAAQILGVSEGTVKSRAARGRARLLPRLKHLRPRAVREQNRRNQPAAGRLATPTNSC
jgi:RNA polymerase sigma-70 factor, ECF subfamily